MEKVTENASNYMECVVKLVISNYNNDTLKTHCMNGFPVVVFERDFGPLNFTGGRVKMYNLIKLVVAIQAKKRSHHLLILYMIFFLSQNTHTKKDIL